MQVNWSRWHFVCMSMCFFFLYVISDSDEEWIRVPMLSYPHRETCLQRIWSEILILLARRELCAQNSENTLFWSAYKTRYKFFLSRLHGTILHWLRDKYVPIFAGIFNEAHSISWEMNWFLHIATMDSDSIGFVFFFVRRVSHSISLGERHL